MSAFKHTSGPWVAALDHNSRPIVWGPGTWQIADCWHTPDGNGWGNARLIAAAPELLEALRGMLNEHERLHALFDLGDCQATVDARAAIEKATGGTA